MANKKKVVVIAGKKEKKTSNTASFINDRKTDAQIETIALEIVSDRTHATKLLAKAGICNRKGKLAAVYAAR